MNGDITFTPSPDLYVAAAKLCFRHQLSARRLWIRLLILTLGAMIVAGIVAMAFGGSADDALAAAALGALYGLLVLAIIIGGTYLLLPRRSRRLFSQDKSIAHPTRFTWNDEEAEWASGVGSYRVRWEDHHGWAEDPKVLIFFANERLYRFLPIASLTTVQRRDIVQRVEAARADA